MGSIFVEGTLANSVHLIALLDHTKIGKNF